MGKACGLARWGNQGDPGDARLRQTVGRVAPDFSDAVRTHRLLDRTSEASRFETPLASTKDGTGVPLSTTESAEK